MTKDALIEVLTSIEFILTTAADSLGDVGAFLDFKDDQEGQFWEAYDHIRFQAVALHNLANKIKEQV